MIGPKFNRIAAILVLGAVLAWIGLGEFGRSGSRPTPPRADAGATVKAKKVGVVVVATRPYRRTLIVTGRTEAKKIVAISARGPGIVDDLPVPKGTLVAAGTVIARLADEGRTAALKQAAALHEQRVAEFAAASHLTASGNNPRLGLIASRAAADAAAAGLELARVEVDKRTLTTPIAGVVDQIPVERGQAVGDGRLIANVLQLDPIVVAAEVSERAVARAVVGRPAEVRLVTGSSVAARVTYVSRSAAEKTRTYRVEVEAANPDLTIASGLTAEVSLPSEPLPAVRLPRSVLSLADDGAIGVRLVGADDRVAFVAVEILDDTPDGLWLGGIPDGARVIVAGQEFVKAGEPVVAETLP